MSKVFSVPFALNGDKTPAIPDGTQPDGSVSYNIGFGLDYEKQLGVDPNAKNISRSAFNSLMYEVTSSVLELQAGRVRAFSSTVATAIGGYPRGSLVLRTSGAGYWESTADANSVDPDTSGSNWRPVGMQGVNTINFPAGTTIIAPPNNSAAFPVLIITGALTTDIRLNLPVWAGMSWTIDNRCTGTGRLLVASVGATGVYIQNGAAAIVACDGTNIISAPTGLSNSPVVGASRNARVSVPAFSGSLTYTADEVEVKPTLGSISWLLSGVNKTINGATTGVGGMDTGVAPASGAVAVYLIYNDKAPLSTTNPALLGWNATSAVAPEVYSGGNMPAGYTHSALVTVWRTTPGTAFDVGYMVDRTVWASTVQVLSTTTMQASLTTLPLSTAVPRNAKTFQGVAAMTSTVTPANLSFAISGASVPVGQISAAITNSAVNGGISLPFANVPLVGLQTAFYSCASNAGTSTLVVSSNGYTF